MLFLHPAFLIYGLPGFLLGIILHEVAHGWVAYRLGDPTARAMGRLTLNPRVHIDPIGALMFVLVGFGWAKPVPINPYNFRDYRTGMALSSIAGPVANLSQLLVWAVLFRLFVPVYPAQPAVAVIALRFAATGAFVNGILMVFNLIPIPPLDGSRILAWMLPPREAAFVDGMERWGFLILLGALWFGLFRVILPGVEWVVGVFLPAGWQHFVAF
jgi:Zn-dependent protease